MSSVTINVMVPSPIVPYVLEWVYNLCPLTSLAKLPATNNLPIMTSSADLPNPDLFVHSGAMSSTGDRIAAVEIKVQNDASAQSTEKKVFIYPWMASKNFDLLWYFAPILVAIAATYLIQTNPNLSTGLLFLFIVNAFGVGPAHQGPTWFFYFDKRNREHWASDNKRIFIYYLAPILVFAASVVMAVYQPGLNYLITAFWGIQHLIQQNFGITLLYHNKNNNEAMPDRNQLQRSLWTPAILFTSIFFFRVLSPSPIGKLFALDLKDMAVISVFAIIGLVAVFDVGRVLVSMRKQVAGGARLNVPAFMFWVVSVIYFVPYILPGQKIETVTLINGTMHWFQYIGLNMILVNQKYAGEDRKHDIPCGAYTLLAMLCIGSTLFFLFYRGIQQDFAVNSLNFKLLMGVYIGLANVHYFQDAFFWRFREKFQRDNILPFLMQARKPAVQ